MATKTFINNGVRYEACERVIYHNGPGIIWVRWIKTDGAWVRSGSEFHKTRATRREIISSFFYGWDR